MKIESLHPGVTVEKVQENCGFELLVADNLETTHSSTGRGADASFARK